MSDTTKFETRENSVEKFVLTMSKKTETEQQDIFYGLSLIHKIIMFVMIMITLFIAIISYKDSQGNFIGIIISSIIFYFVYKLNNISSKRIIFMKIFMEESNELRKSANIKSLEDKSENDFEKVTRNLIRKYLKEIESKKRKVVSDFVE